MNVYFLFFNRKDLLFDQGIQKSLPFWSCISYSVDISDFVSLYLHFCYDISFSLTFAFNNILAFLQMFQLTLFCLSLVLCPFFFHPCFLTFSYPPSFLSFFLSSLFFLLFFPSLFLSFFFPLYFCPFFLPPYSFFLTIILFQSFLTLLFFALLYFLTSYSLSLFSFPLVLWPQFSLAPFISFFSLLLLSLFSLALTFWLLFISLSLFGHSFFPPHILASFSLPHTFWPLFLCLTRMLLPCLLFLSLSLPSHIHRYVNFYNSTRLKIITSFWNICIYPYTYNHLYIWNIYQQAHKLTKKVAILGKQIQLIFQLSILLKKGNKRNYSLVCILGVCYWNNHFHRTWHPLSLHFQRSDCMIHSDLISKHLILIVSTVLTLWMLQWFYLILHHCKTQRPDRWCSLMKNLYSHLIKCLGID